MTAGCDHYGAGKRGEKRSGARIGGGLHGAEGWGAFIVTVFSQRNARFKSKKKISCTIKATAWNLNAPFSRLYMKDGKRETRRGYEGR